MRARRYARAGAIRGSNIVFYDHLGMGTGRSGMVMLQAWCIRTYETLCHLPRDSLLGCRLKGYIREARRHARNLRRPNTHPNTELVKGRSLYGVAWDHVVTHRASTDCVETVQSAPMYSEKFQITQDVKSRKCAELRVYECRLRELMLPILWHVQGR